MCEFLSVRQFAQSSATRHLQTQQYYCNIIPNRKRRTCLLYTSDAADE